MKKKYKVISLFSGCGGLDLGFKWDKYKIIWANDIMKNACESYKINIDKNITNQDIRNIEPKDIPDCDVVIGGPPCQGFSGIGKRDPVDERSSLVWNYVDIINEKKPKIFLFENVGGLRSAKAPDGSKVINNLQEAFLNIGYSVDIHFLNSADYGVPQKRKRIFIVGNQINKKINAPKTTHSEKGIKNKPWVSSYEALSDLDSPSDEGDVQYIKDPDCIYQELMRNESFETNLHFTPYSSKTDLQIMKHVKPGGNYMDIPDNISTKRILYFKKTGGRTTTYGRLDPSKPSYTLNTYFDRPNIGCNIHYEYDRMITIREGLRLQSFPDNFNLFSTSKRDYYVQVGNAVPPLLSYAWAKHIRRILNS